mgnify:CR=1 FL=1
MREKQKAFRGAMLGLAVGDAMGSVVDRKSMEEICNDYGPNGLLGYDLANGYADMLVTPSKLRKRLYQDLLLLQNKNTAANSLKKHGNIPL